MLCIALFVALKPEMEDNEMPGIAIPGASGCYSSAIYLENEFYVTCVTT